MNQYMERVTRLRDAMKRSGADFFMIPTADYHQSEYVADFFKTREFFSGFTGSNGTLLISSDFAGLWTDGRYFIQAERELAGSGIVLMRMADPGVPTIGEYLLEHMPGNGVLAFDGRCVSALEGIALSKQLASKNVRFRTDLDPAEGIWQERPALPCSEVFLLDEAKYAGETTLSKLERLRREMKQAGTDCFVTGRLDEIMWLFNIRANDVECNPVALSYAVVTDECKILFLQKSSITPALTDFARNNDITILPYEEILTYLQEMKQPERVLFDAAGLSYALYASLLARVGEQGMQEQDSPLQKMKAVKNPVEIENIRSCYIEDSAALCKFIYRISKRARKAQESTGESPAPLSDEEGKPVTEYSAAMELDALRAQIPDFVELSFPTIAGYGPNAAMMHYDADEDNAAPLLAAGMYLVDSGGQYLRGTTDVTRTFALGPVTDEMKKHFTLTAVGNLQLQSAVFLYGCTGKNVDILSREPLWQIGIDYKCGTGHGIGYLLNVHEGPQNIRWRFTPGQKEAVLEEGMIVSDEPGVYLEGKYGIRIETILLVRKICENGDGTFLGFEPLTFVPIDRALIDPAYLTPQTCSVLNAYHQMTYEKIAPFLNEEEQVWLREQTAPITIPGCEQQ